MNKSEPDKTVFDAGSETAADILGDHGPFAESKPGFRERSEQQQLATAIENCIAEENILVAEAGTGVGKTFAYLVPALTCGKRVIVSTGTRHLQDQLFHTDLPVVSAGITSRMSLQAVLSVKPASVRWKLTS